MTTLLPSSMDYSQTHASLPENMTATQITLSPANGSTFNAGSVVQFDYLNRGFIVPDSIFIRYRMSIGTLQNAGTQAQMIGTPVYTPFVRNETLVGSSIIESANQWNQICNVTTNLSTSVSSKYGLMAAYGYLDGSATSVPNLTQMDGRNWIANETATFSGMVPGILSNCEKLIPAFAMGQIRSQFTIDSVANMFVQLATTFAPTAITISNFELVYTMLDAGPAVENMVRSLGTFYIKSQSIANSSVTLASGTSGSVSLVYNQRLASVKSAYVLFTGTTVNSLNKWGDAYDPTTNNGEVSINVGGISYPQRPLSMLNAKSGILQYLRNTTGSIYDRNNELSINAVEWNRVGNEITTVTEPAKFYLGFNLEKLHTNALLTGISTQNSAITVLLSTSTATAQAHTVNLLLSYDALIEVDTASRMVTVKQ